MYIGFMLMHGSKLLKIWLATYTLLQIEIDSAHILHTVGFCICLQISQPQHISDNVVLRYWLNNHLGCIHYSTSYIHWKQNTQLTC